MGSRCVSGWFVASLIPVLGAGCAAHHGARDSHSAATAQSTAARGATAAAIDAGGGSRAQGVTARGRGDAGGVNNVSTGSPDEFPTTKPASDAGRSGDASPATADANAPDQTCGSPLVAGVPAVPGQVIVQAGLGNAHSSATGRAGLPVALSGDTLAVGAARTNGVDRGVIQIFVRVGAGWSLQAKLTSPADLPDDLFGNAIALSGNWLAVGASDAFFESSSDVHGRVHMYERVGSDWVARAVLTAPAPTSEPAARDDFGHYLTLAGDWLAVSTKLTDNTLQVMLYERSDADWIFRQSLRDDSGGDGAFGETLSMSGSRLAIGAYRASSNAQLNESGFAHVYVRSGAVWSEEAKLFARGASYRDWFGYAVTLDGDRLLVSAPLHQDQDGPTPDIEGKVYLFARDCHGVWVETASFLPSRPGISTSFGYVLALAGNAVMIGAPTDGNPGTGINPTVATPNSASDGYTGAVHLFLVDPDGSNPRQLAYLKASSEAAPYKYFGTALATDGERFIVAADGEGNVYTFE